MKTTTVLLTAILLGFTACSQNNTENLASTEQTSTQSQDNEQSVKKVSKPEFKAFMAEHTNYTLIDIRTPQEFNRGTIEGAININYNSPNFQAELNKLDKSKPVLMFCQSGGRSGRALPIFKSLGFEQVLELQGGYGNY
jgi:rhodanese-related sulfurtransferase